MGPCYVQSRLSVWKADPLTLSCSIQPTSMAHCYIACPHVIEGLQHNGVEVTHCTLQVHRLRTGQPYARYIDKAFSRPCITIRGECRLLSNLEHLFGQDSGAIVRGQWYLAPPARNHAVSTIRSQVPKFDCTAFIVRYRRLYLCHRTVTQ